jgi:hypothetical protein
MGGSAERLKAWKVSAQCDLKADRYFGEAHATLTISPVQKIGQATRQRFRLVGVILSNFHEPDDRPSQPVLFA